MSPEPYTWLTRTPMLAVSPTLRVKLHFRCGGVLPEGGALPVWGCTSGVWVHFWCRGAAPAMFSSVSSFLTPFGTIFFGKIMFANIFTVAKNDIDSIWQARFWKTMFVETDFDETIYIIILDMIADPLKARSK